MKTDFEYGFWFWSHKLTGILTILSTIASYSLLELEIENIVQEMRETNDELNQWTDYSFNGLKHQIDLQLAYDAEDFDMIHLKIKTTSDLKEKLETINLFQSIFKNLELEK